MIETCPARDRRTFRVPVPRETRGGTEPGSTRDPDARHRCEGVLTSPAPSRVPTLNLLSSPIFTRTIDSPLQGRSSTRSALADSRRGRCADLPRCGERLGEGPSSEVGLRPILSSAGSYCWLTPRDEFRGRSRGIRASAESSIDIGDRASKPVVRRV